MASTDAAGGKEAMVRVQFRTRVPEYAMPPSIKDNVFELPMRLNRLGLSEVVNHLLGNEPPIPFQFIVSDTLLRTSVKKHLKQLGVSTEVVVVAEYAPAVQQPTQDNNMEHPDWIGALSGIEGGFATGCYDGVLRLHAASDASLLASATAHGKPITGVHLAATTGGGALLATSGKDCTVKLWSAPSVSEPCELRLVGVGSHEAAAQAVAMSPSGAHMASAAWDGSAKVWAMADALSAAPPVAPSGKRRRRASSAGEEVKDLACTLTLGATTQSLSAVTWVGDSRLATGGYDHTIRVHDVEAGGTMVHEVAGGKVITGLVSSPSTPSVLVTSHPDHWLRLWDTRASTAAVQTGTFKSHTAWVTGVSWSPDSEFLVASASHDHTARLWDIRSPTALHTLGSHEDKALCVGFAGGSTIVSGGADRKAKLYRMGGAAAK